MKPTAINKLDRITSHQGYHAGYKDEISCGDSHVENEMCTTERLPFENLFLKETNDFSFVHW